jgi:hypothetical protein
MSAMTFWQFLNDNIFWLVVFGVLFGGGFMEGLSKAFDGRRKAAKAVQRAKSAENEVKRLERLLSTSMSHRELSSASGSEELVNRAHEAITDRYEALGLLRDVQTSDKAFPQLPQDLRDDIDALVQRTGIRGGGDRELP